MATAEGRVGTAWEGGSLDELLVFLAEGALSARVEAFDPGGGFGHIDVIAGGIADAEAGQTRGDEAIALMTKREGAHYRVELRLPHPTQASLDPPGDREGPIAKRPVASIMRYCEEFVLTCALVLERQGEVARVVYRRGEITATLVDGTDATHRLPDVMAWTEGSFRIDVVAPEMPRRTAKGTGKGKASSAPAARGEVSTLFGYPVPGSVRPDRAPTPVASPSAGPRLGERPTPKVPVAAVAPDPASTRPTPRAPLPTIGQNTGPGVPSIFTSASVPTPPSAVAVPRHTPAVGEPAPLTPAPGSPDRLARGNFPNPAELRLPETGFLAQPVIIHVIVGVALGLLTVAAYWAYLRAGGTPLQLG